MKKEYKEEAKPIEEETTINSGKEILTECEWHIKFIKYKDGSSDMTRENKGFSGFELIGLCETMKQDVLMQMRGDVESCKIRKVSTSSEKV